MYSNVFFNVSHVASKRLHAELPCIHRLPNNLSHKEVNVNRIKSMALSCSLFLLLTESLVYTKSACIIVHGTWASRESWYQKKGDFFEEIATSLRHLKLVDELVSFTWSGQLGGSNQMRAAEILAEKILEYEFVIIVGHSHGATVGIFASKILAEANTGGNLLGKIRKFYALGVPVDPTGFAYPDMNVVHVFYNLFSFGDMVQTVQGIYGRCFAQHERIANISVMIEDRAPSHANLHHPVIAKSLLKIHEHCAQNNMHNFSKFNFSLPGEIIFLHHDDPKYEIDLYRELALEVNKKLTNMFQPGIEDMTWRGAHHVDISEDTVSGYFDTELL